MYTYLGDSFDHVSNMGADSSDSSNFLLLSKPLGDLEFILLDHLQERFKSKVRESLLQLDRNLNSPACPKPSV